VAARVFNSGKVTLRKLESALFFLSLAFFLELIARAELISPLYFPPVSQVAVTFFQLCAVGVLPSELMKSLLRMAFGLGLTAIIMTPLGVLMGISPRWYNLLEPLFELLRPIPPPVIVPVAMLFLGIGNFMKVFVVFFACSFPVAINTIDGVRSVPPMLLHTARSFGLGPYQIIRKVVLPAAAPQIMSGFRTSLPIALIVAILAEMIGSVDGIGHYILKMQRKFEIPEMYAGIIMLGLAGYLINRGFLQLDQYLLAWHKGWKRAGK
jgi:ABC-type nitrate/sulfonate/bicarbonate transport system permease component